MSESCVSNTAGATLVSPCRNYSLRLEFLYSLATHSSGLAVSQPAGLLLAARIDGLPVRLLLDSGAAEIILDKHTAARLGRSSGAPMELVGAGERHRAARRVAPGGVKIGELTLRDCPLLATESMLGEGIDGIVPLSLFAGFLVRLDTSRRTLSLQPYPALRPAEGSAPGEFSPVRADGALLFLEATSDANSSRSDTGNEARPGYVLLDTGAVYSGVAVEAARNWTNYRLLAPRLFLVGVGGATEGYLLPPGVHFHIGSRVVEAGPSVVMDLSSMQQYHPFAISGVLGYPALASRIVTVDYRDSLVSLGSK